MGRGSRKTPKKNPKIPRRSSSSGSSSGGGRSPGRGGRSNIVLRKLEKSVARGGGYGSSTVQEAGLRVTERSDNVTPLLESSGERVGWDHDTVAQGARQSAEGHSHEYSESERASQGYQRNRGEDAWSLNQLVRDGVHAARGFVEGSMREVKQYLPSPDDSQDAELSDTESVVESSRSSKEGPSPKNSQEEPRMLDASEQEAFIQSQLGQEVYTQERTGLRMADGDDKTGGDGKKKGGGRPKRPGVGGRSSRAGRAPFRPGVGGASGRAVSVPKESEKSDKGTEAGGPSDKGKPDETKPKPPPKKPDVPDDGSKKSDAPGKPKKPGVTAGGAERLGVPPKKKVGRLQGPGKRVMRPQSPSARGRPTAMHPGRAARPWQRGLVLLGDALPIGLNLDQLKKPPGLRPAPPPPPRPNTPAINLVPPTEDSFRSTNPTTPGTLTPPDGAGGSGSKSRRPLGGPAMVGPNALRPGPGSGDPGDELEPIFQCPGCSDSGAILIAVIISIIFIAAFIFGGKKKDKKQKKDEAARKSRLSKFLESRTATKMLGKLPTPFADKSKAVRVKLGGLGRLIETVSETVPMGERIGYQAPATIGPERQIDAGVSIDHRGEALKQLGLPKSATWEDISLRLNNTSRSPNDGSRNTDTDTEAEMTTPPPPKDSGAVAGDRASDAKNRDSADRKLKKTLQGVKPEKWGGKDWHLYSRIATEMSWCPSIDVKDCLPPGKDNEATVAKILAEVQLTLDYFTNTIKKQKEFQLQTAEAERRATIPPETGANTHPTTSEPTLIGVVTAIPGAASSFSQLVHWMEAIREFGGRIGGGLVVFFNHVWGDSTLWNRLRVRGGLIVNSFKEKWIDFLVSHTIPRGMGAPSTLIAAAKSSMGEVLQYWFPPLAYYIGDQFLYKHPARQALTILQAVTWYQLSTAQLLVVFMWPVMFLLRGLHILLRPLSPTYRAYYYERRTGKNREGVDLKILRAIGQCIRSRAALIELQAIEGFYGSFGRGIGFVSGAGLVQWFGRWVQAPLLGAGRWWLSVPILGLDLGTFIVLRRFQRPSLVYALGRVWHDFFMPPIHCVTWVVFIANTTHTATALYTSRAVVLIWHCILQPIATGVRRVGSGGSGTSKPPATPRRIQGYPSLTPGGGGFMTPGGTRHPVPFAIDQKLLQSERRIAKSMTVRMKYEETLRKLRVLVAETRHNLGVLKDDLGKSTDPTRQAEIKRRILHFERMLGRLKVHMAQNVKRVNDAKVTMQHFLKEYDMVQDDFGQTVVDSQRYASGTFRGQSQFKDLRPPEAGAAIERNMLDMGIKIPSPEPLPPVVTDPSQVAGTPAITTPGIIAQTPATQPKPNVAGRTPVATVLNTIFGTVIGGFQPRPSEPQGVLEPTGTGPLPPGQVPLKTDTQIPTPVVLEVKPDLIGGPEQLPKPPAGIINDPLAKVVEKPKAVPPETKNESIRDTDKKTTEPTPKLPEESLTLKVQNAPASNLGPGNVLPGPADKDKPKPVDEAFLKPPAGSKPEPAVVPANILETRVGTEGVDPGPSRKKVVPKPKPEPLANIAPEVDTKLQGPKPKEGLSTTTEEAGPSTSKTPKLPDTKAQEPKLPETKIQEAGPSTSKTPKLPDTKAQEQKLPKLPDTKPEESKLPETKIQEPRPPETETGDSKLGGRFRDRRNILETQEDKRTERPTEPTPKPPPSKNEGKNLPSGSKDTDPRQIKQQTGLGHESKSEGADKGKIDIQKPGGSKPPETTPKPTDNTSASPSRKTTTQRPTEKPANTPLPSDTGAKPKPTTSAEQQLGGRPVSTETSQPKPPTQTTLPPPFEPGRPNPLLGPSTTDRPPSSTGGARPPSFADNKPPSPYNSRTEAGGLAQQPPNPESSDRHKSKQPVLPPQTHSKTRSQPHTSSNTGGSHPPAESSQRKPKESNIPKPTPTITSPGGTQPDMSRFNLPPTPPRGSNLHTVGVTHTPSTPSPTRTQGESSPTHTSTVLDRFAPGRFGWTERKPSDSPTTANQPSTAQELSGQPPVASGSLSPAGSGKPPTTPKKKDGSPSSKTKTPSGIKPPTLEDLLPSEADTPMRRNVFRSELEKQYYEREERRLEEEEAERKKKKEEIKKQKQRAESAAEMEQEEDNIGPGIGNLLEQFRAAQEDRDKSQAEREEKKKASPKPGGSGSGR
ncbi:hypothetical protein TWF481_003112 [Arthrobotrys musiformis]|uniref:Uncharacterized protein n=1 Tax=Arthrobotrys musiformis TaxID=47236 RepID=A0AAV9VPF9_9PEZI